jgi:hypothetical protein
MRSGITRADRQKIAASYNSHKRLTDKLIEFLTSLLVALTVDV